MESRTDQLNIIQMQLAKGGPGFWVRRTTWECTCARVVGMGTIAGAPPYFGNPPVVADIYSLDGRLREELARLPVPGTFKTWREIEEPSWASAMQLRSLDDPSVAAALLRHDRRRPRAADDEAERVPINVPFARKDEAKKLGARWDATRKVWWIAADNLDALAKAAARGFLPI